MKIKRYKKVNRRLSFYNNYFGFRKPYQLLIDGTFCLAALKNQINIADNIPKYLHSELKLLTTQCALIETEQLGNEVQGALVILKQYALHSCGHEGKPLAAAKCFATMIGLRNEQHYIIATQDKELHKYLQNIPGVPLLHLVSRAPVLDRPSSASMEWAQQHDRGLSMAEKCQIDQMKIESGIPVQDHKPTKKKKKKGPNPLSCLKKKSKPGKDNLRGVKAKDKACGSKNAARNRYRIPKHVRDSLYANVNKIAQEANPEKATSN